MLSRKRLRIRPLKVKLTFNDAPPVRQNRYDPQQLRSWITEEQEKCATNNTRRDYQLLRSEGKLILIYFNVKSPGFST
jgi:hypothetical protein